MPDKFIHQLALLEMRKEVTAAIVTQLRSLFGRHGEQMYDRIRQSLGFLRRARDARAGLLDDPSPLAVQRSDDRPPHR